MSFPALGQNGPFWLAVVLILLALVLFMVFATTRKTKE